MSTSSGKDNHLWLQMWRSGDTEFHQLEVNRFLIRFLPEWLRPDTHRVFVPFCGKSLDLVWLVQQGYEVVGVELSPLAVRSFFEENSLDATTTSENGFERWTSGRLSILCGDYFSLDQSALGKVDLIYDRAGLAALSEESRKAYVAHLRCLVPADSELLLLTIEDSCCSEAISNPPVVEKDVATLFADNCTISLTHHEPMAASNTDRCDEPNMRSAYNVYRILLH